MVRRADRKSPQEVISQSPHVCFKCPAFAVIFFRGAWVCEKHYQEPFQIEADAWCKEHGLLTTEDKINYCRTMSAKIAHGPSDHRAWMKNPKSPYAAELAAQVRNQPTKERIPGSDDE